MKATLFYTIIFCLLFSSVQAQNAFLEGEIVYKVKIENKDPNESISLVEGEYHILLKGSSVLKVLELKSGFSNTMLYQGKNNVTYSLRTIGKENVAIELNSKQTANTLSRCSDMEIENLNGDLKTFGSFKTEKAIIRCNDRNPLPIYYTKEWSINNKMLFEEFPSFSYLPLSYTLVLPNGSMVHYTFQSIESKPLDNSLFNIPKNYKKISYEEFRTWQH